MNLIGLINALPFGEPAEKGYFLYTHVPEASLAGIEAGNFRKSVEFAAAHSAFYRRKFAEHGIRASEVRRPEDLGDFFTTPEDIRANPHEFVCLRPDTAYETTGTTSKKSKRVYFNRDEVREAGWAGGVGLWGLGLRKEDRVASAFDYSFWVSGPVLAASCATLGCFHVEAGRLDPEDFYDRLKDYGITAIVGDPSWIVRLSEVAEKRGPWPMKLFIGGGENLTEAARAYVEKVWKADFILSYGQTEAFGAIGMESRAKDGYHLNSFHNLFEIVDRDADGWGELVYTTLNRRVMPLIRYKSGDVTRFLEGRSKSGLPGKRIDKLKGRIDEWTPTAMGNIAPWMFETLFSGFQGIVADWQIEVTKEESGVKDRVTFHLEHAGDAAALRAQFLDAFGREFPEQTRQGKMGLFSMDVAVHAPGSLRTGRKLKRIVDKRKFGG